MSSQSIKNVDNGHLAARLPINSLHLLVNPVWANTPKALPKAFIIGGRYKHNMQILSIHARQILRCRPSHKALASSTLKQYRVQFDQLITAGQNLNLLSGNG